MQIIGGNFGQLKNIQSTTNIRREGKTKKKAPWWIFSIKIKHFEANSNLSTNKFSEWEAIAV